ncbi:MAG: hypothetical protein GJT30_16775 [Geobacter sp.]|nr:hypothetical protein [Geobacter sp.]
MKRIKPNLLSKPQIIFFTVYLVMYLFSVLPTEHEEANSIKANINSFGITCHFISIACFSIGSYLALMVRSDKHDGNVRLDLQRSRFNVFIWSYCAISIGVLLWQIVISVDLNEYLTRLMTGIVLRQADPGARNFVLLSHEQGGLSGLIKMFSFLPLSALYMVLTEQIIVNNSHSKFGMNKMWFRINLVLILLTVLIRASLALDRGVLMYFIIIITYYVIYSTESISKSFFVVVRKPVTYLALIVVVYSVNIISGLRQGIGLVDTLIEYCALGLANLSILLHSEYDLTYGLNLLNVIMFPLKYFGLLDIVPEFRQADFVWNPARYLTAYAYQDFGIMFILFFIFFGFVSTVIFRKAWFSSNPCYLVVLFPVIVAIIGSFSIPPFRGPEWWVSMFMAIIGIRLSYRKQPVFNIHEP